MIAGRQGLTAADYARLPVDEIRRRLAAVRDRMERAGTMADALADAYCEQELSAALTQLTVD